MKEGVRRQLEGLGAVGLQREGTPDAAHGVVAQTGTPGHGPGAPVGGVLGGGLQGQRNHPLNVGIVNHPGTTAARLVQQAVQPLFQESGTPFPHRVNVYPQLGGHPSVAPAIGTGQNDSGPQGQRLAVLGRRVHCSKVSRSAPSRAKSAIGLPLPIFILPFAKWSGGYTIAGKYATNFGYTTLGPAN